MLQYIFTFPIGKVLSRGKKFESEIFPIDFSLMSFCFKLWNDVRKWSANAGIKRRTTKNCFVSGKRWDTWRGIRFYLEGLIRSVERSGRRSEGELKLRQHKSTLFVCDGGGAAERGGQQVKATPLPRGERRFRNLWLDKAVPKSYPIINQLHKSCFYASFSH